MCIIEKNKYSLIGILIMDDVRDHDVELAPKDKYILGIRSAIQLIPFGIGSAIERGYFGTIDEKRIKRIEIFFEKIAHDLFDIDHKLKSKIDEKYFTSDEYAYLFERILRRVSHEISKEKLNALRGALFNIIILQPKGNIDKQSSFVKTIDLLEGIHIQILRLLYSRLKEEGLEDSLSTREICSMLDIKKESESNFVYSAIDTLANRKFIQSGPVPFDNTGKINKEIQRFICTPLGAEFIDFVRSA